MTQKKFNNKGSKDENNDLRSVVGVASVVMPLPSRGKRIPEPLPGVSDEGGGGVKPLPGDGDEGGGVVAGGEGIQGGSVLGGDTVTLVRLGWRFSLQKSLSVQQRMWCIFDVVLQSTEA